MVHLTQYKLCRDIRYMTEQELVSQVVEQTLDHYYDRFVHFMQTNDHDTAIEIGNEIREWMDIKEEDQIIYCSQTYLQQVYQQLIKKKRRRKRS